MPEIDNKLYFKNNSLSSLLKEIENDLATYIDSGQNLAEQNRREKEAVIVMKRLAARIHSAGICPEGTVWDPISRTCKPPK